MSVQLSVLIVILHVVTLCVGLLVTDILSCLVQALNEPVNYMVLCSVLRLVHIKYLTLTARMYTGTLACALMLCMLIYMETL